MPELVAVAPSPAPERTGRPRRAPSRAGEVEFLPSWYPRLRRRRRRLLALAVLTVAALAMLPLRLAHTRQLIRREEASLVQWGRLRDARRQADLVLAKLGRHVEPARLLAAIDRARPPGVRLTELEVESEPGPSDFFSPAYLAALRGPPGEADRRVRVQLRGAAPSPVEAANFVAALSKRSSFRDVAMTDARERPAGPEGDAAVHDFRVSFWLDLAAPVGEED